MMKKRLLLNVMMVMLLLTHGMNSNVIGLEWDHLKQGNKGKIELIEGFGDEQVKERFEVFANEVGKEGDAPSNPVVLVPGIGGSVMNYYHKSDGSYGDRVWVDLLDATKKAERYFLGEYNPDTGMTEVCDIRG
eukprot:TRINITY_DN1202_c0_g2_i2.p1 TRINITY_DN1202_c0_g2~~TRINITY_DN1202_c0_g2_i2.p1  ORF type:complete len:133 (-),score=41.47 TRINITY_DN1202_c0_g2_i2:209-607(-)